MWRVFAGAVTVVAGLPRHVSDLPAMTNRYEGCVVTAALATKNPAPAGLSSIAGAGFEPATFGL